MSNVAERSLCSTLAQCLYLEIRHSKYSRYYVDIEYNRNNGRVKTIYNDDLKIVTIICDLIVYSRGEIVAKDNLIALEMKEKLSGLQLNRTNRKIMNSCYLKSEI